MKPSGRDSPRPRAFPWPNPRSGAWKAWNICWSTATTEPLAGGERARRCWTGYIRRTFAKRYAFAIILVYLLIVVNFQSWLDPFIIITALPAALAGIVLFLFITHTTLSVPVSWEPSCACSVCL